MRGDRRQHAPGVHAALTVRVTENCYSFVTIFGGPFALGRTGEPSAAATIDGDYNGEMKRLMLAHAFRFVDRVILRIGETNARSRRAAEKIGAKLQPGRRAPEPMPGVVHLFYAIERADFLDAQARA